MAIGADFKRREEGRYHVVVDDVVDVVDVNLRELGESVCVS